MSTFLRALGAAFLTAGALAIPSVAHAAEQTPIFGALTERGADGKSVVYPIKPGESVPVVLGVTNRGTAPSNGVVVNIRVLDDLNLTRAFTNCVYYVWSNLDGAWCEFDQELPVGGTYALWPFRVTAEEDAKEISSVVFQWFPRDWADNLGGIEELAKRDSGQGTTPAAGTHTALALQPKELPVPDDTARVGFAYLRLVTPPTSPTATSPTATSPTATSPTATPPTTAPTEPTTAPTTAVPTPTTPGAPAGGAGGAGGGLPVTGANAATVAGVGLLLVVAGGIGLIAARRRTRFTAN